MFSILIFQDFIIVGNCLSMTQHYLLLKLSQNILWQANSQVQDSHGSIGTGEFNNLKRPARKCVSPWNSKKQLWPWMLEKVRRTCSMHVLQTRCTCSLSLSHVTTKWFSWKICSVMPCLLRQNVFYQSKQSYGRTEGQ